MHFFAPFLLELSRYIRRIFSSTSSNALVLAVVLLGMIPLQANAQSKQEMWYYGNNITSPHNEDPEVLCRSINVSTASTIYYNGFYYDPVNSGLTVNSATNWKCKDINYPQSALHATSITLRCVTLDAAGSIVSMTSGRCTVNFFTACLQLGNPTNVLSLAKEEPATDWVSPRDPRFVIQRYYSSNADSFKELGYPDQIKGILTHGSWKSGFDEFISEYGSTPTSYRPANGRILPLPTINSATATKAGLPYKLTRPNSSQPYYWIEDGTGKKMRFQRYPGRTTLVLIETDWPDGYSIFIDRDPTTFAINVVRDNKGNRAVFTATGAVTNNTNNVFATKIQIDSSYDGVNFAPDIELQYSYQDNLPAPGFPPLTSVVRGDLIANTAETLATYTFYDTNKFWPPLLIGKSGGGGGTSSFGYRTYGLQLAGGSLSYPMGSVMGTSRGGGARSFEFGLSQNTSTTRQVEATNALGLKTSYTFEQVDGYWMPTRVDGAAATGCLATAKTLAYTPNAGAPLGFVYSRTERNGARTDYTRDARGLVLTKTEDAVGSHRVTSYTWHSTLRLPLTRATPGLLETFTYTPEGLVTSYTQTDTKLGSPTNGQLRSWTYTYTTLANGLRVLASTDGPGLAANGINDVTTNTYTAAGELATSTDANGLVTTVLARNDQGKPTLVEEPNKNQWSFTYDRAGRLLTSGFAGPGQTPLLNSFVYNGDGNVVSMTNTLGKTWAFAYDGAERLTQATAPNGDISSFSYDGDGNITRTEYRNGAGPVTFWEETQFDALSRVLKTIGAQGQQWAYSHDKEDNLVSEIDPLNNITTNGFDALNRLTSVVDRQNYATGKAYNAADQLTEYTDPRSIKTSFTYNGFGDVIAETSADRGSIGYTYDQRGLVSSRTDGRGVTVSYGYDNGSRLTLIDYPPGGIADVTLSYDQSFLGGAADANKGSVGRIVDATTTTSFQRSPQAAENLITTTALYPNARSYTVIEAYNFEGEQTAITYPSGRQITYSRGDAGDISQVRLLDGTVWTTLADAISYKPNGPLASMVYGDGYTQTRTYDSSYRLTGLTDSNGSTTLRQMTYGYESRDNLTAVTDALTPTNSEAYGYTPRESLASATGPYGAMAFTYDGVGNRVSYATDPGTGLVTDSYSYPTTSNRLGNIALGAGGSRAFSYDAAGNVTLDDRTGGGYSYSYDSAGRMATFSINGVLQAEYKYDFAGRQAVRKLTAAGVTIHSVFDAANRRIAEYDEATGALIREYIWLGWEPIGVIEGGVISYIRTDHIGRPVFATNAAGATVWTASYLPFGGVQTTIGTVLEARFPGQWFQSESGLHQNWMRDYDPTTGRYLQADPLGLVDGASVYGYVKQNPGRWSDPEGLFTLGDAADSLLARRGVVQGVPSHQVTDQEVFEEWLRLERSNRGWLSELPSCPCDIDSFPDDGWYPKATANAEHPGGYWERRSWPTNGGHASQCVYDKTGALMTNIPAAGTADYSYFDKSNPLTYYGHWAQDLDTFWAASRLGRVSDYYSVRPIK